MKRGKPTKKTLLGELIRWSGNGTAIKPFKIQPRKETNVCQGLHVESLVDAPYMAALSGVLDQGGTLRVP